MSRNKNANWSSETPLSATGLPFVEIVLAERFLLPPESLVKIGEKVPETLGEVAEMSGMPLAAVTDIIEECIRISKDLWTETQDLDSEAGRDGTIVLDMRPDVQIDSEPLHPAARLFHAQNPQTLLPYLRTLSRVIVISHSDAHAWSAAMSLRKMGITAFLKK